MSWLDINWTGLTRPIAFANPLALYLLTGAGLVLVWSLANLESPRKIFAPILRVFALALGVLALAGPQRIAKTEGATRPAIVDVSASITPQMRQWTSDLLLNDLKLRSNDPVLLFARATVSSKVGEAMRDLSGNGCSACLPDGTDLESALRAIGANAEEGGPIILVTDGWENHGDADRAIGALAATRNRLYIFTPPAANDIPNVAVSALSLPRALTAVEPFNLSATLENMNRLPASGTLSIYENDRLIDQKAVTLASGEQRFDFPVRSEGTGLISYRAVYKPSNPALDVFPEDDSVQGWVGIGARRRLLILTDSLRDASYLETVVKRLGMDPVVIDLGSRPFDGSLSGYDTVILNNVPRSKLAATTQSALAGYVEHGGSLAMVGGDQSFGLGDYQNSDIAKVMPVVMKPPQHKQQQRALVLIIDKSGSMGRDNKLQYAKAAALTVTKTLGDDDLLCVIGFDSQPFVVVPLQTMKQTGPYLSDMIDRLKARGTTYLLPALKEAERDLAATNASLKHVVILTDGETGGTAAMYYDLVSSMHREGNATISTIAIGRDPNVRLLTSISQYGGGGFYQTDSAETLPEIFLQDMKQHGGEVTLVEKEFAPRGQSPDPVLKELAGRKLPNLRGYVGTELKSNATLSLYVDRDGRKDPLVASWKYGTGKTLAVTTDANGRWSSDWISENAFGPVWDKLLTWLTPETNNAENFDVALGYRDGRLNIALTDYSEDPRHSIGLVNAFVASPDGHSTQLALSEAAPGEISGSIDAPRAGTYYIELKSPGSKARVFPPLAYTVSPAATAEQPRPAPNYGLLEHLASATGGRLNPLPDEVALSRPTIEKTQSLSSYFLFAVMVLLIFEALVRRLTV
jgi:Ca-activated chloride channel family protein